MESCRLWAQSGAMFLTGDPDGEPLAAPALQLRRVANVAASFGASIALLGERAAAFEFTRHGQTTAGGATKLIATADGYVAVCLARPEDQAAVPALVQTDTSHKGDHWNLLERHARDISAAALCEQAELLGIAASTIDEPGPIGFSVNGDLTVLEPVDTSLPEGGLAGTLVVDFTSLWAGPLCTQLLRRGGATVIKVESTTRPDGARSGAESFYDSVNAGKLSVAVDFAHPNGHQQLQQLINAADIVVTSSRKRAFEQLEILPEDLFAAGGNKIWAAISAHGWDSLRIGFGDDAAVAAGAVAWGHDSSPRFLGDALADPVCAILLADTIRSLRIVGGHHFIDAPLSGAVRSVWDTEASRRPALTAVDIGGINVAMPQQPHVTGTAQPLGADNDHVFTTLIPEHLRRAQHG